MAYPYRIVLTEEQRAKPRGRVGSGVALARMLIRARILLKAAATRSRPPEAIPGARISDPTNALDVGERIPG